MEFQFLLCFITLGHFLLLNFFPAAEASGRCEYHLTSPVLPGNERHCILQVALFESGPAVGNLTLLIKPVHSSSAVHSEVLNHRRRDDRRYSYTLGTGSPCLRECHLCRIDIYYLAYHVHLISVTKQNHPSLLIEVLVKLRSSL